MTYQEIVTRGAILILRHGFVGDRWNLAKLQTADAHQRKFVVTLALLQSREAFAPASRQWFKQAELESARDELINDIRKGLLKS